ncbi:helix-turn-helix domain-containing protein [Escherichia coli]|uniref:helix-turn-helix domain-containing protein n=1 Tax=Escherichia coli TaxID=562 RepID=UPI00095A4DC6|nr:helix-turn-helix domain-containing protein [Escherichia coli]OKB92778.1 AraC family transcriptional regulator [Escherichia coli]
MAVVCSVILVCSPINIFIEKDKLSLVPGMVILVTRNIRELFRTYTDRVKVADINHDIVSQYLEGGRRRMNSPQACFPHYLTSGIHQPVLAEALITNHGFPSGPSGDLSTMTGLSCLSLFANDESLSSFLSRCLSNTSDKVRAIIQGDISVNWKLGVIALQLHMSESLLKKKLKDEGNSFSRLLLEERMRGAVNMLCFQYGRGAIVAEKCGYSSLSYFISVFHRYYGVPPDKYVSLHMVDF